MSYDIYINSRTKEFEGIIDQIGFKQQNDRHTVVYERPTLKFHYKGNSMYSFYHGNAYNAVFMYKFLSLGLMYVDDFSFTDPQMDLTFTGKEDVEKINWDYLLDVAKKYTNLSYTTAKPDEAIKKHFPMERTIPVEYKTLHILSHDLMSKDLVNAALISKGICAFAPTPLLMINPTDKTYKVVLSWAGLLDMVIPVDLKIDLVGLGTGWGAYNWEDLVHLLPKPEEIDLGNIGKYHKYSGVSAQYGEILEKLKDKPFGIPKEYSLDYIVSSPYSVF
jgi:hypothetical protein